ncbi:MAG: 30S ribosomal protein S12 methylthiotransferase RimO [candidate division Zixibacteria bacterium]|nr:30S ribosomal protein S12 methylthiotransferase RimO [candidate division Zixibacteria bacterium]
MKFYLHKLGCPKNDVDADYISARLIDEGHLPVASPDDAESIIVNTCGFILPAKEESINEILRLGQLKKQGTLQRLYATGCLTQRYGDEMLDGMPELDGAFGHGALDSIATAVTNKTISRKTVRIESRKLGYLSWRDRYISDGFPYSYLKISDGCDRACAYCAIPLMRGKFRSRPLDSLLREAEFLARNGKRELILVSQEATMYGYGLPDNMNVIKMLQELEKIDELKWIRLMYLYPAALSEDLIDYLLEDNKTLPYFDLPLQHISDSVLTAMRRRVDRDRIERLIERIRSKTGRATLRTTFIVGFPGETDADFAELVDFTQQIGFDRMGVFPYSPEEGTPAEQMSGQVPEEIKTERMDTLMTIQREIAFAKNVELVGRRIEVLIDSVSDDGHAVARSRGDCPDIDQEVHVQGGELAVGQLRVVHIDSADGYDLSATTVST